MSDLSIAEMRRLATTPIKRARFNAMMANYQSIPYTEWADDVEAAVADACIRLARKRNIIIVDEDNITGFVLAFLEGMGYNASMALSNGNADIFVESDENFIWIAEAKIGNSPGWIMKGYRQLTERYAIGQSNQDRGGLLIYCAGESVAAVMASWRAALAEDFSEHALTDWRGADQAFHTLAPNTATGRNFRALHLPVALMHTPTDATRTISVNASKAAKAAKAKVQANQK